MYPSRSGARGRRPRDAYRCHNSPARSDDSRGTRAVAEPEEVLLGVGTRRSMGRSGCRADDMLLLAAVPWDRAVSETAVRAVETMLGSEPSIDDRRGTCPRPLADDVDVGGRGPASAWYPAECRCGFFVERNALLSPRRRPPWMSSWCATKSAGVLRPESDARSSPLGPGARPAAAAASGVSDMLRATISRGLGLARVYMFGGVGSKRASPALCRPFDVVVVVVSVVVATTLPPTLMVPPVFGPFGSGGGPGIRAATLFGANVRSVLPSDVVPPPTTSSARLSSGRHVSAESIRIMPMAAAPPCDDAPASECDPCGKLLCVFRLPPADIDARLRSLHILIETFFSRCSFARRSVSRRRSCTRCRAMDSDTSRSHILKRSASISCASMSAWWYPSGSTMPKSSGRFVPERHGGWEVARARLTSSSSFE
eukprot:PhM_4_TR5835/c0_g2_i1/m.57077